MRVVLEVLLPLFHVFHVVPLHKLDEAWRESRIVVSRLLFGTEHFSEEPLLDVEEDEADY